MTQFIGNTQLTDYISAIKEAENVVEVFAFLITHIDDKFARKLKNED
jgi:hypothetical protein